MGQRQDNHRAGRLTTFAHGLLIAALAWGAFAFGAVYPWAWWPLVVALQIVAWSAIVARLPTGAPIGLKSLSISLALSIFACIVQLVPIPLALLRAVSPAALDAITRLEPAAAVGLLSGHPLSIRPHATLAGVIVCASLALLVIGSARLFSIRGARVTVEAITVLGVLLALVGIVQKPLFEGRIYGFWTPEMPGNPFGPFVNKNHFAGWMVMALPLVLGLICASIEHGMRGLKPGFRERLLWFSSVDASRLVLLCGAAVVMTLSLVLATSRSALFAFSLAMAITVILVVRRQATRARKAVAVATLLCIFGLVLVWFGVPALSREFADPNWHEFHARVGAWKDAWSIARRFPLTGTGLNTYEFATLLYQTYDLSQHYAQAHNDYLQLLVEGGILIAVPVAICAVLFVRAVVLRFRDTSAATTYWIRVGAVAGLAAMALQETVEFSLQMPGNAALFAVLCGIALHRAPDRRAARPA